MQKRGRRVALLALLAVVWAGSAMTAASAEKSGEHRVRLVRSWPENPIVDGRAVPGRVEIWFDYTAGVAIHKVVASAKAGAADTVVSSRTYPPGVGTPRPSPEEIAEAMETARQDKEIARLIAATNARLDGGFQVFEPAGSPCGPGSRCLKVQILTSDGIGFIRNVVVDLTTQTIPYRTYMPVDEGKGK